jgi:glycosyltransferase involved in cell wall biosynthesis
MPTYNKLPQSQWLLEEAVESYYRNVDMLPAEAEAELIICNDTPGQTIKLAEPRHDVVIHNLSHRFENLGDKLNWMTQQAGGKYVCRWDDDDLSLPWGLKLRYETMRDEGLYYLCYSRFYATNGPKTSVGFGSFAQCMYLKEAADAVGGYKESSFGEDQDIEKRLKKSFGKKVSRRTPPTSEDTFYVYRWGTGSEHLSGYGAGGNGWNRIGKKKIQQGTFVLKPHWKEDYVARCDKAREQYDERQRQKKENKA